MYTLNRRTSFTAILLSSNLTLILLFILSVRNLCSQPITTESQNKIALVGGDYEVHIVKEPFQILIDKDKKGIAKVVGLFSEDSSGLAESLSVVRWDKMATGANVLISDSNKEYYSIQITLNVGEVEIQVLPSNNTVKDKLGVRFDAAQSGHWFGGKVVDAHLWPLEGNEINVDPFNASSNQASPIWYTSKGLGVIVETHHTMGYSFNKPGKGIFELYSKQTNNFTIRILVRADIREAYYAIANILGKPSTIPPIEFFKYPQFNTWIEFFTKVNQAGIEKYTQAIRANGFPASIFIIDDKWTKTYGDFEFDPDKFPDPVKMVGALHQKGLKVALWVTPFIEKAAANYNYAAAEKFLITDETGNSPYIRKWWNGQAAIVDLSNPEAYNWFLNLLKDLQKKYGIDGFKLDGGDANFLDHPHKTYGNITPNKYSDIYVSLGRHFEINELKIGWLAQSMGLVQRLRDKAPSWNEADGIRSIIPHAMTASMIGYYYLCPDIIGGGLDQGYLSKDYKFDEELFVRWTEASALMPMMQFSLAPWKLSKESVAICKKYSELHVALGNYIYFLAEQSKGNSNPIVRPLFFEFPKDDKTFMIKDQFMLGDRFLVAPVLQKGATSRSIYLPAGTWMDFWTGKVVMGGQRIEYSAPLDVLPILIKAE